jgi:hypothetical protein
MCKYENRILTVGRSCRSVEIRLLAPMTNCGCYTMHPLPGLKHSETGYRFVLLGGFHLNKYSQRIFHYIFISSISSTSVLLISVNGILISLFHISRKISRYSRNRKFILTRQWESPRRSLHPPRVSPIFASKRI